MQGKDKILNSFVLVNNNKVVSPVLTTTREYGDWLENVFDKSICQMELYMKSKKTDGTTVLEKHPGTNIGRYFDKAQLHSDRLKSWFVPQESDVMDKLVKLKLAEQRDAIPISVNDEKGRRMIRLYTTDQVNLYIQTSIDRSFNLNDYLNIPLQVKISDVELATLIKPVTQSNGIKRKKLF